MNRNKIVSFNPVNSYTNNTYFYKMIINVWLLCVCKLNSYIICLDSWFFLADIYVINIIIVFSKELCQSRHIKSNFKNNYINFKDSWIVLIQKVVCIIYFNTQYYLFLGKKIIVKKCNKIKHLKSNMCGIKIYFKK